MRRHTVSLCIGLITALVCPALAEDILFFQASAAGPDAWSWGGASVKKSAEGVLVITEQDPANTYGDAYASDRFPFIPAAEVTLDIGQILMGVCTLQVLCFRGDEHFATIDAAKDIAQPGATVLKMADIHAPPETQSVMLKLWVAGEEGAGIALKDLVYRLTLPDTATMTEADVGSPAAWTSEGLEMANIPAGMRLALPADKSYSSAIWELGQNRGGNGFLLTRVSVAKNATLTVQLAAFDGMGTYLESVTPIQNVGNGWHGVPLSTLDWPDGADGYKVKLWVNGTPGGAVVIDRLAVLEL